MLKLNEFDTKRLMGIVYLNRDLYKEALKMFQDALAIKQDPRVYYHMAYAYCYLKEYKKAQQCALKSIELGYDCYDLFTRITVGNLQDIDTAIKILRRGVNNKSSFACIELAKLHIDNNLLPDMLDPIEASTYLDMAFEYAPKEKRGIFAYFIYKTYGTLYSMFPKFVDFKSENSELFYMNVFNSYEGALLPPKWFNIELFDVANKNDDYSVIDKLLDRFDGDAYLIFALLLLYDEYKRTGTILIPKSAGMYVASEGARRFNNGGCYKLTALCYWSNFEESDINVDATMNAIQKSKEHYYKIPKTFESFYIELMNHLYSEATDGSFGYVA